MHVAPRARKTGHSGGPPADNPRADAAGGHATFHVTAPTKTDAGVTDGSRREGAREIKRRQYEEMGNSRRTGGKAPRPILNFITERVENSVIAHG
jgi:hypothetical protein